MPSVSALRLGSVTRSELLRLSPPPMLPLAALTAAQRRTLREESFTRLAAPLADAAGLFGPPVLPLAPWHHLFLLGADNPLLCGGPRRIEHALQYLWICSPRFVPTARLRFRLFCLRWRRPLSRPALWPRVLAALDLHASGLLLDRPVLPAARRGEAPATATPPDGPHELAALESLCRRHLGYTGAEFWHTPYAHTNQLLALYFRTIVVDAPKFDPARDRAAGEFLRQKKRRTAPR